MATRALIEEGQSLIAQIDYLDSRYYDHEEGYESINFSVMAGGKIVLDADKLVSEAPPDLKTELNDTVRAAIETAFETIETFIISKKAVKEAELTALSDT